MYLLFPAYQRLKQKTRRRTPACSSTRTVPISERSCTDIEPEEVFAPSLTPVSKQLSTLRRQGHLPRGRRWSDRILEMKGLSSERFCAISTLVLMKSGRVQWRKAEETRQDFKIVLIRQDKKFFISELFEVIQDGISLILHYWTMY